MALIFSLLIDIFINMNTANYEKGREEKNKLKNMKFYFKKYF